MSKNKMNFTAIQHLLHHTPIHISNYAITHVVMGYYMISWNQPCCLMGLKGRESLWLTVMVVFVTLFFIFINLYSCHHMS